MSILKAILAILGFLIGIFTGKNKIKSLKRKVEEITNEIIQLEKNNSSDKRLDGLYAERLSLNREIRRLQRK